VRITLLILLITCTAGVVHAQSTQSKSSVSAIAGAGQTWDDEGSLGRGWLAGAAIDRTLIGGLRAEVSVEVLAHDRAEGFLQANGRTLIGGVSLLQRFGHGQAQPYVFAGATAGHHSGSHAFGQIRSDESSTDTGWRAGLGLAMRAGVKYEISPEVRLNGFFIDTDSHPATALSFGIRVAVRL
jgi:hypothetical protein